MSYSVITVRDAAKDITGRRPLLVDVGGSLYDVVMILAGGEQWVVIYKKGLDRGRVLTTPDAKIIWKQEQSKYWAKP
jgi:hypothetical protein